MRLVVIHLLLPVFQRCQFVTCYASLTCRLW